MCKDLGLNFLGLPTRPLMVPKSKTKLLFMYTVLNKPASLSCTMHCPISNPHIIREEPCSTYFRAKMRTCHYHTPTHILALHITSLAHKYMALISTWPGSLHVNAHLAVLEHLIPLAVHFQSAEGIYTSSVVTLCAGQSSIISASLKSIRC